jgi:hypothetical protein
MNHQMSKISILPQLQLPPLLPVTSSSENIGAKKDLSLSLDDVEVPDGPAPVPFMSPPLKYNAVSRGILQYKNDLHSCNGNWASSFEKLETTKTSQTFCFVVKTALAPLGVTGSLIHADQRRNICTFQ